MADRILIKNGIVLTQDDALGELNGDVAGDPGQSERPSAHLLEDRGDDYGQRDPQTELSAARNDNLAE